MKTSRLTDYQLFELLQNAELDAEIKKHLNNEFNKRNLSIEQITALMKQHDASFKPAVQDKLSVGWKFLLIFCPFFVEIHSLIAGRMLANGYKRKWKNYWFYLCIGYLIWTVAIIVVVRINRNHL